MQSKLLGWLVAHISSKIHLGTISWYPQRQHFINTPVEISSDIFLAFRNRIKCSPVFHRCTASAFDRIFVETVDHRIAVGQFLHVPVPFLLSLFSTVIFFVLLSKQIMDVVEGTPGSIGIKAVIADRFEVRIGNMTDELDDKRFGTFPFVVAQFCLVVVIEPMDAVGLAVVFDDPAFCHGRTADIAEHILDAGIDIFGYFRGIRIIFESFLQSGIDIKSIVITRVPLVFRVEKLSIGSVFLAFQSDETKKLELKGLAQLFEAKMGEGLDLIFFRIVNELGNQSMDVGVPFQIASESMESGNHTELFDRGKVFEFIERVDPSGFFKFLVEIGADHDMHGIACGDKKEIEAGTILKEPAAQTIGNSEDKMAVADIETDGRGIGSDHAGILDAAGIAEAGMAAAWNAFLVMTDRAFEEIVAKKISAAQEHFHDRIEDAGAKSAVKEKRVNEGEVVGNHMANRMVNDVILKVMGIPGSLRVMVIENLVGKFSVHHK